MNKRLLLTLAIIAVAFGALLWVNRERPRPGSDIRPVNTPPSTQTASKSPADQPPPEAPSPPTTPPSVLVPAPATPSATQRVTKIPAPPTPMPGGTAVAPPVPQPVPDPEPPTDPTAPSQPPALALEAVRTTIREYGLRFGGNPVGTNAEITKALDGANPKSVHFLRPDQRHINGNGELVDPWGTPYFFHQLSANDMETRSAGPDKIMWTSDDLVTH